MHATETQLQEIADFDHPFVVAEDGSLSDAHGIHAPEVLNDDDEDLIVASDEWEALKGYTGQYGYNGAVMHPSEYLGGGLARDILATPGTYVCVVVDVLPTDDDEDPDPAGWAVLRHV